MRAAGALRQQLLQNAEPTIRDREIATLAAKVEARARALARAESRQRMQILSESHKMPEQAPRVIHPEMEHIVEFLADLNRSKPEAMSYYAEEKMRDLLLDVAAPATDLRLLDPDVLGQINGVVLGEPEEESFVNEVTSERASYPAEDIFVDTGEVT